MSADVHTGLGTPRARANLYWRARAILAKECKTEGIPFVEPTGRLVNATDEIAVLSGPAIGVRTYRIIDQRVVRYDDAGAVQ